MIILAASLDHARGRTGEKCGRRKRRVDRKGGTSVGNLREMEKGT
jgi:hypothetical protein